MTKNICALVAWWYSEGEEPYPPLAARQPVPSAESAHGHHYMSSETRLKQQSKSVRIIHLDGSIRICADMESAIRIYRRGNFRAIGQDRIRKLIELAPAAPPQWQATWRNTRGSALPQFQTDAVLSSLGK